MMESIATYDRSASDLQDIATFWTEVDELLSLPVEAKTDGSNGSSNSRKRSTSTTASILESRLDAFYALCDDCYDMHIEQGGISEEVLTRLLNSPLVRSVPQMEVANVLITLVTRAKSLPTLHLLLGTILLLGQHHPDVYKSTVAVSQLIPRLVHHFWAARYAEEALMREATSKGINNGRESDTNLDWNIKHIRIVSTGDAHKEKQQLRDRRIQCKIRDEAIVLLYEICRAQRMALKDMRAIDATFVNHLFDLVEASRHFNDDSYNYQLIKLIVALNEQFMVAGIENASSKTKADKTIAAHANIVMTVLRTRLHASNTFAENLIWMLNRASSLNAEDICMQLLVLKLLYLLFTTRETSHYFYLNDLKVLVDVFIRELNDLPEDSETLRHTYLRVLHPLLTNTQLLTYPYKRIQIQYLLQNLISRAHLRDISSTTKRLVDRCLNAEWCTDLELDKPALKSMEANGDEKLRTLTVQSVSGGIKTVVQAQTRKDSEGVTIALDNHQEPFHGAPTSTSSTLAVAAAKTPSPQAPLKLSIPEIRGPIDEIAGNEANQHRFRDKRVNSVGGLSPTTQAKLALKAEEESGKEVVGPRRDISNPSTLSVRRDLGQRASSARSAMPLHHSHDSYDCRDSHDPRDESDDEESSRWSNGSGSNSWQLGMAGESSARQLRQGEGDKSHMGSPLSREVIEPSLGLTTSPLQASFSHWSKPEVRVEQILTEEGITPARQRDRDTGSGSEGVGGEFTTSRRRKPPAPPSSSDGDQINRKLRRPILTSTSETNLPSSLQLNGAVHNVAAELVSLPDSPNSESIISSREASPTFDQNSVSKRRRPPPPPINRATKGIKAASQQIQLATRDAAATGTRSSQQQQQERTDEQVPVPEDADADGSIDDGSHLERAMQYLYVSDAGYGW